VPDLNRLARAIAIAVGVLGVVAALGMWQFNRVLHAPLSVSESGGNFEIAPGSSFATVSKDLAAAGIMSNARLFRAYARWTGRASAVQAGEYHIEPGTSAIELLEQFTSGDVRLYSFTIVEGWNQWDLLRELNDHSQIDATLTDRDWPALLAELGEDRTHAEGLFLPETYRFPRNTTDRALLTQAYELMQQSLTDEWAARDAGLPVRTPYEALILASIVEKETARVDERPRIAGVFLRRLERRMRLQTDPTVIYGIGPDFNGNLTRQDMRKDTPYNTYTRYGLPPTPIALPGRAAIHAVLHPSSGNELYFVATGLGDGSHKFSATKEEHDAAVSDYLRRLRDKRR
jgi:UPF0755 protein